MTRHERRRAAWSLLSRVPDDSGPIVIIYANAAGRVGLVSGVPPAAQEKIFSALASDASARARTFEEAIAASKEVK